MPVCCLPLQLPCNSAGAETGHSKLPALPPPADLVCLAGASMNGRVQCAACLQELLSAGSQDLSVQQLPGLLAQIVQHVGEDEAALRIVAHFHAVLVCETVPSAASQLTTALHPLAMAGKPA